MLYIVYMFGSMACVVCKTHSVLRCVYDVYMYGICVYSMPVWYKGHMCSVCVKCLCGICMICLCVYGSVQ